MSEDREILRTLWEGRVAACITLAAEDLSTVGSPDPHYLMLPRVSYFPLVLDKVRKSFQRFVPPELKDNEIWLEFEEIPLKMHYPIGALCDLHNRDCSAPWQLTLHFSPLPPSLISLPTRDCLESQFLSFVKEADALKHRSSAVLNTLQSRDHKQLWLGLVNDKFDQFWSINQKLMDSSKGNSAAGSSNSGAGGGNTGGSSTGGSAGGGSVTQGFRSIPFKLHLPTLDASGGVRPTIMRLQRPVDDDGQPLLVSHLLEDTLADVLEPEDVLVVQGVVPPRDTPLLWLSQHLSYPDNFLHFCVRKQPLQ